jgi:3-oxoacyl-[acyl-carrier protein] reductase
MWTLITGAGSGIGRALAIELSQQGYSLILAGRTTAKLEQVAVDIRQASPGCELVVITADFANPDSTRNLGERVCDLVEGLSTFVYCAGVGEPAADFAGMDLIDFQEALAVNVSAPMLLTQTLLPVLQGQNPPARIVMTGAGMDKQVQPGTGSYGISKMALNRLVQQLAVEFDADTGGPMASLFQPGLVDTPGIRAHIESAARLGLPHAEYLEGRICRGECLTAEEAARALAHTLNELPDDRFNGAVLSASELLTQI